MMARAKAERYTSPKGIAVWPRLNEPDTKFKATGEFSTKLAYEADDAAFLALVAKLEGIRDIAFAQFISENPKKKKTAKVAPVAREELDEDGEETGRMTLTFKMNHKITSKAKGKTYTLTPDIFDALKRPLKNPPNIGGGSTLRVSFEVFPCFVESAKEFHTSLRMVAVQVIDLVEFGTRDGASYGFDEEEDGFAGSEKQAAKPEPKSDDSDDDGDGDGDDDGDVDY